MEYEILLSDLIFVLGLKTAPQVIQKRSFAINCNVKLKCNYTEIARKWL